MLCLEERTWIKDLWHIYQADDPAPTQSLFKQIFYPNDTIWVGGAIEKLATAERCSCGPVREKGRLASC